MKICYAFLLYFSITFISDSVLHSLFRAGVLVTIGGQLLLSLPLPLPLLTSAWRISFSFGLTYFVLTQLYMCEEKKIMSVTSLMDLWTDKIGKWVVLLSVTSLSLHRVEKWNGHINAHALREILNRFYLYQNNRNEKMSCINIFFQYFIKNLSCDSK